VRRRPRSCGRAGSRAESCWWARSLSRPYERPPLSKDYLRGESDRDEAFVHEQGFGEEHQVDLLPDASGCGSPGPAHGSGSRQVIIRRL